MLRYPEIHVLASRQHSLVTRAQFESCGIGPRSVSCLVRAGKVERVRRNVYRLCGVPPTWRSSALAAVLTAGAGAVLSHRSAAALWGLLDHHDLTTIEITHRRQCRQSGITTHVRSLDPRDRTVHERIPVTSVERTLVDLAAGPDVRRLEQLVDEALRQRLITVRRLTSAVERVPATRSTGRTRANMAAVLATRGPATTRAPTTGRGTWTAGSTRPACPRPGGSTGCRSTGTGTSWIGPYRS